MSERAARILVVEDSETHAELVRLAFRSRGDRFELAFARSLEEARESLRTRPPSLVLTDLLLPDGRGVDLLPRTRSERVFPVVVMTGYGDESIAVEAMKAGAADYVAKSAETLREMPHIVERALREWEQAEELRRAQGMIRTQRDLAVALCAVSDVDQAAQVCMESAFGVSDMECVGVYLAEEDGGWRLVAHRGLNPSFASSVASFGPRSAHATLLSAKRPTYTTAAELADMDIANAHREGLRAVAVVPIEHEGRLVACLNCATQRASDVPPPVRNALESIAAQMGGAIAQHQARAKQRESEGRLRSVFETAEDSIFIKDLQGVYTGVNPAMERLFGEPASRLLGRTDEDLFGAEAARHLRELDARVLSGEVVENVDTKPVAGVMRTFHVVKAPMRDHAGAIVGLCGIARDVTDRRLAEEALRESEAKYAALVEQAQDGIAIIQDERFVFVNRAMAEMTGYTVDEMIGMSMLELVPSEGRDDVASRHRRRIAGGEPPEVYSADLQTKDGRPRHVELSVGVLQYAGRPAVLGLGRDMTERRRLEDQLRQRAKMAAIGQLAGGIAHDFNTFLTAILGHANMLRLESPPGGLAHETAETIERAAQAAAELTGQLLRFARRGPREVVAVDVHETIDDVIRLLSRTFDKAVRIERRFDADPAVVLGDPGQIQQILLNLAVNARHAMPEGGDLVYRTRNATLHEGDPELDMDGRPGDYLVVTSADTGCGMSPDVRERIFEPLFTTRNQGEGTGMGLATVYGIVKDHGGWVNVESAVGSGAVFDVFLPAAPDATRAVAPIEPPSEAAAAPVRGSGRILLVDDEPVVRGVATAMLEALGYEVLAACDGQEALGYFEAHGDRLDLIILDMVMPGMDGRECFEALRRIDPEVRVLLSTGYDRDDQAREMMERGMLGVVRKPYDMQALSSAVAEAIRSRPAN